MLQENPNLQNPASQTEANEHVASKRKAVSLLFRNFFIWFVPGLFILGISLLVILILTLGTATGMEFDIYKRLPKGLVSFLGIAYCLSGLGLIALIFVFPDMEIEGLITVITGALVCFILGVMGIKRELRRLSAQSF